jgi:hypothetical protein
VYRKFGNAVMILAVLSAMGAHWTVLQSIAWTTMLADNLGRCSLSEAVHQTFDGRHPCCLCKAIAEGKKSEEKKDFTPASQRLEFPLLKEGIAVIAPAVIAPAAPADTFADLLSQKPPTPPPRGLFV